MNTCNPQTIRCKFPQKCCHDQLFKLLQKVDCEFKKHDIRYILYYGSLLGAIRENNIISDDTDVDIIIMKHDVHKLNNIDFKPNIYKKHSDSIPGRINISEKNTLHVDVWVGTPDGTDFTLNHCNNISIIPMRFFDDTTIGYIRDQPFPIPTDSETAIRRIYGENWRTPQKTDGWYEYNKKYE